MRRESALSPLADERQCAGCEQLIVAHASRFSKEQRSDQVVDKYEIEQTNECWYVESASHIPNRVGLYFGDGRSRDGPNLAQVVDQIRNVRYNVVQFGSERGLKLEPSRPR